MRSKMFTALLLGGALTACKWTDFDDLADQTWVRSTEKQSVSSNDYALAIVGATASTTGGRLAVVSNDSPSYSTLEHDGATGDTKVGPNIQRLGNHFIAVLAEQPILLGDGAGKIALVERAIDQGNVAVVFGPADAIADLTFPAMGIPDAATYAGADLVISVTTPSGEPNLFYVTTTAAPAGCVAEDDAAMPLSAAALAADATHLWAWTKRGVLLRYLLADVSGCDATPITPVTGTYETTGFSPGSAARIHLVGPIAILAAHADRSRNSEIAVVNTADLSEVERRTGSAVEGLRSSELAAWGGTSYLVVGYPDRTVAGVVAGQVELYAIDPAAPALTATPALVLHDASPESGQQFGRSVTTMKFNDKPILVVAANNEVFSYYKTSLYDALP
jgi:hypothetical protein